MINKEFIEKTVIEKLQNTDYYLVDVTIGKDNDITVEVDNNNGVSIDDCVMLSNYIEENLDREKEDYSLEVGSSGITSPFKTLKQYRKNIGNEVEMLLKNGTKLSGILKDADENAATVTVERKVEKEGSKRKETLLSHLTFKYEDIKYTKYLIRF
ncbi:MAG: ribosome assembly cofactor RimP [Tannerella sp.]|jgi:ribosome maturation factor RimP|nr:ribosome assembly cofactor RimP [Tannerella sp.]